MDDGMNRLVSHLSDEEAWIRFENATDAERETAARSGAFYGLGIDRVSPEVQNQFAGYMRCRRTYLRALEAHRLPQSQPVDNYGRTKVNP
jgi:hypothetical protein